VADPQYLVASRWFLGAALLCTLLGLCTRMTGPFLGVATILVVVAMLVRLAAPAQSGLPMWNDFIVLGDSAEYAGLGWINLTGAFDGAADEQNSDRLALANTLAAVYSLFATSASSGEAENDAETLLKGITNYADARIAFFGVEALLDMRNSPKGFFAACTGLGMTCVVGMMIMLDPNEFARWMLLIGPFSFFTGAILYALNSPKWFRGRIRPYRGRLLMHQNLALNQEMMGKVALGLVASAMVSVHIWVIIALAQLGAHRTDDDHLVAPYYPTPVPRLEHAMYTFPFSLLCGLVTLSNYGGDTSIWLFVLVLLVPGLLGTLSMFGGESGDILKFLGVGSNRLILLGSHLVRLATSDAKPSPFKDALFAATTLDQTLDDLFAADPEQMPHRMSHGAAEA
jgi:hypothetical protein